MKGGHNSIFNLSIGVLGLSICVISCLGTIKVTQAIGFFLFQVLFIAIPGMAILIILDPNIKTKLELLTFGYGIGFVLNIFSYYISVPFELKSYLPFILFCETGIACIILYKNRERILKLPEDGFGNIIVSVFCVLIFLLRFILYYSVNMIPGAGESNFFNADILYYIGNAIELSRQYPPMDFRWYEIPYRYHYLGSMQLAVMQAVVKMPMALLELSFGFIQQTILLVFASCGVFRRLFAGKKECILGMILLLLVGGLESYTFSTYFAHLYIVPFGFDYGIAFLLYTFLFFFLYMEEKKINYSYLLIIILFFSICNGAKSPLAIIILGGMGCSCAYKFIVQREYKKCLLCGSGLIISFLIIYFGIVSDKFNTINSTQGIQFQLFQIIETSKLAKWGMELLPFNLNILIKNIIISVLYFGAALPYLIALLVVFIFNKSKQNKIMSNLNITCIGGVVFGILMAVITHQNGYSEMYFFLATIPLGILSTLSMLTEISTKFPCQANTLKRILIVFAIFLSIVTLFQYKGYLKRGVTNSLMGAQNIWESNQANLMSGEEYEAYCWVRENTEPESIIATNAVLMENQGRSFITGVFTERHIWLEGWEYGYTVRSLDEVNRMKQEIKKVSKGEQPAIEQMKEDGVVCFIQLKKIDDRKLPLSVAFENSKVAIYYL